MQHRRILLMLLIMSVFPYIAYAGVTVKGRVLFEGTPPTVEKVEVKSDISTCGDHKEVQKIALGADKGIANAVVTIIGAQGTVTPKIGKLDQVHCQFEPHVQVLPVGSTVNITSSDPVLHNSHGFNEDGSTAFNVAVPIVGMEVPIQLKQAGVTKLRCDAGHTWMSAYLVATDQPYYALTDANGDFSIGGVPPGDYEVQVWQEALGKHKEPIKVADGAQPVTITLKQA